MITISSVSGGKTSAYMAVHFPTDYYLFAPVLTNDPSCVIQDKGLRQYCASKVSWFDWDAGGCRELDLTLSNLRELEQLIGQSITWVSAPFTYDELIFNTGENRTAFGRSQSAPPYLPTRLNRFCTESLKVLPMAWWTYFNNGGELALTQIGFRYDEPKRVEEWKCDKQKMSLRCDIEGTFKGKHRHEMVDYQMVTFPLYREKIVKADVVTYWSKKGWQFPLVSNCDFCFYHKKAEMKHQFAHYPEKAKWWMEMEEKTDQRFNPDHPLSDIIFDPQTSLFDDDLTQFSCLCYD